MKKVLITVLIILVVGVAGYLAYKYLLAKEEPKKEEESQEDTGPEVIDEGVPKTELLPAFPPDAESAAPPAPPAPTVTG